MRRVRARSQLPAVYLAVSAHIQYVLFKRAERLLSSIDHRLADELAFSRNSAKIKHIYKVTSSRSVHKEMANSEQGDVVSQPAQPIQAAIPNSASSVEISAANTKFWSKFWKRNAPKEGQAVRASRAADVAAKAADEAAQSAKLAAQASERAALAARAAAAAAQAEEAARKAKMAAEAEAAAKAAALAAAQAQAEEAARAAEAQQAAAAAAEAQLIAKQAAAAVVFHDETNTTNGTSDSKVISNQESACKVPANNNNDASTNNQSSEAACKLPANNSKNANNKKHAKANKKANNKKGNDAKVSAEPKND